MTTVLKVIHILSPAATLICYLASSFWQMIKSEAEQPTIRKPVEPSTSLRPETETDQALDKQRVFTRAQVLQRALQLFSSAFVFVLYVGEATALLTYTDPHRIPGTADENVVFALFSSLLWMVLLLSLLDVGATPKGRNFNLTWSVASAFELIIFLAGIDTPDSYPRNIRVIQISMQSARIATTLALGTSEYFDRLFPSDCQSSSDEETAPLLVGRSDQACHRKEVDDPDKAKELDLRRLSKNWWLYVRGFKLFLPIILPQTVQQYLCILGVGVCILLERAMNVALPVTLGAVVTALSTDHRKIPWTPILLYIALMILESSAGVSLIRDLLWQPVDQLATQRMKRAAYEKLMNLSCDFHDNKKSDVTFQTVQRGAKITDLVEIIGFQLLPMAADLVISISVFWFLYNGYLGFVVGVVVVLFMWSTLKSLSLRQTLWREYIEVWEREWYSMTESVKSWDAVSHFGRIPFEMNNFREKTDDTRKMQIRWMILSKILGSFRNLILIGGLGAGACIVAHQIVIGYRDVGKFIVFTSYWAQLSTPLHFFAHGFNQISKGLVDAEKLLTLFEKTPMVQNAEEARPFVLKKAAVDFKNVSFSYDGKRSVTKDVTFHAEPGKIIAFVGETGCGKSTLFKLLFRFYDPKEGNIYIDEQDIREVTLDSFREHIGIVPQEPALFNKSIRENLRYPDLTASDKDIEDACRAVSLHDKIISFTKGYDEVVGERGTKLSGGEKQRVAIARAILKNPDILLLDEATSSVDSTTEAQIQASLKALCADRTTFVIAHRLSTIVNADQVVVMDEGKIVESGTHASLIKQNGPYKKLWTSQLSEHISELRGRSRSRSKCQEERQPLLVNDMNTNDKESKKLLAETTQNKDFVVQNRQTTTSITTSSHDLSHEKQYDRGRNRAKSARGTAESRLLLSSKSPKQSALQRNQMSSSATNMHTSDLVDFNSENTAGHIASRNSSAVDAANVKQGISDNDDDALYTDCPHSTDVPDSDITGVPTEKMIRRSPHTDSSGNRADVEVYESSSAETEPISGVATPCSSDGRVLQVASKSPNVDRIDDDEDI